MPAPGLHIALVGNPNSGKTSLFNALTGLNQKVGNFPGVTVDKKTGNISLDESIDAEIIDLPGTYSLYPRRADEWVSYKVLMGMDGDLKLDGCAVIHVIDRLEGRGTKLRDSSLHEVAYSKFCSMLDCIHVLVDSGQAKFGNKVLDERDPFDVGCNLSLQIGHVIGQLSGTRAAFILRWLHKQKSHDLIIVEFDSAKKFGAIDSRTLLL